MTLISKTEQTVAEARPTVGVNDDDLQAGYNDVALGLNAAGGFLSYPAGVSLGTNKWFASNNSGNFNITNTNAAFGQSTAFVTHDPVNANAVYMIGAGAAPFVIGNIPMATSVAGLFADSGIPASGYQPLIATVTLSAAQVIAAYATPEVLIPATAGKVAIVLGATVYTNSTGQTPFATGIAPIIQYGATVYGAGTIAVGAGLVTGDIEAAASQVRTLGPAASAVYTGITNTPVTFSCTTAYTAGTGSTVTFVLQYLLITATI